MADHKQGNSPKTKIKRRAEHAKDHPRDADGCDVEGRKTDLRTLRPSVCRKIREVMAHVAETNQDFSIRHWSGAMWSSASA